MTAEEYLDRWRIIQAEIAELEEEEKSRGEWAAQIRSAFMIQAYRKGGYRGDRMAETVIRIQEALAGIAARRQRLEKKLAEIEETVRSVGDWETEEVLRKRYFKGEAWKNVAAEMGMSESTARRREKDGLAAVERVLGTLTV